MASFEAYNRWLADFYAHAPSRFVGVGYVPMLDVEVTLRMIRECVKWGIKVVNKRARSALFDAWTILCASPDHEDDH